MASASGMHGREIPSQHRGQRGRNVDYGDEYYHGNKKQRPVMQVYQAGVSKLSKRGDGSPSGSGDRGSGHAPAEQKSSKHSSEVSSLQQRLTELSLTDASSFGSKPKRPDIPRYVPKARGDTGDTGSSHEETEFGKGKSSQAHSVKAEDRHRSESPLTNHRGAPHHASDHRSGQQHPADHRGGHHVAEHRSGKRESRQHPPSQNKNVGRNTEFREESPKFNHGRANNHHQQQQSQPLQPQTHQSQQSQENQREVWKDSGRRNNPSKDGRQKEARPDRGDFYAPPVEDERHFRGARQIRNEGGERRDDAYRIDRRQQHYEDYDHQTPHDQSKRDDYHQRPHPRDPGAAAAGNRFDQRGLRDDAGVGGYSQKFGRPHKENFEVDAGKERRNPEETKGGRFHKDSTGSSSGRGKGRHNGRDGRGESWDKGPPHGGINRSESMREKMEVTNQLSGSNSLTRTFSQHDKLKQGDRVKGSSSKDSLDQGRLGYNHRNRTTSTGSDKGWEDWGGSGVGGCGPGGGVAGGKRYTDERRGRPSVEREAKKEERRDGRRDEGRDFEKRDVDRRRDKEAPRRDERRGPPAPQGRNPALNRRGGRGGGGAINVRDVKRKLDEEASRLKEEAHADSGGSSSRPRSRDMEDVSEEASGQSECSFEVLTRDREFVESWSAEIEDFERDKMYEEELKLEKEGKLEIKMEDSNTGDINSPQNETPSHEEKLRDKNENKQKDRQENNPRDKQEPVKPKDDAKSKSPRRSKEDRREDKGKGDRNRQRCRQDSASSYDSNRSQSDKKSRFSSEGKEKDGKEAKIASSTVPNANTGAAGKVKEQESNDPSRSGKGGGIIRIPEGIMEAARKTPSPPVADPPPPKHFVPPKNAPPRFRQQYLQQQQQQQQQQQKERRHDRHQVSVYNEDRLYDPRNPTKPLMASQAQRAPSVDSPDTPPHSLYPTPEHYSGYYGGGRVPPPHPGFLPPNMQQPHGQPQQAQNFYRPPPYGHPSAYANPGYYGPEYGSGEAFHPSGEASSMAHAQYLRARGPAGMPHPGAPMARGGFAHSDPTGGAPYREPSKLQQFDALLQEVTAVDNQLSNLLSRWPLNDENVPKVIERRERLCSLLVDLLFLDLELSNKNNLEQLLWKSCFYQIIELSRKGLLKAQEEGDKVAEEKARAEIYQVLDDAVLFYDSLLQRLETTFQISVADFVERPTPFRNEGLCRAVRMALVSAQKCLIALGDIARYREQTYPNPNYGKARSYYLKAQQLAPKNGRPYNQLAILAVYTKRKLDAVYYYMRSLAASNPFITARESLNSIFDDVRKKHEADEERRRKEKLRPTKKAKETKKRRKSKKPFVPPRVEIWIGPDGVVSSQSVDADAEEPTASESSSTTSRTTIEDELKTMTPVELNRRFVMSFLNVHGRLFTKIGMETFPHLSSLLLWEFKCLLSHRPCPVGQQRLLQLMAINMFQVEQQAATSALSPADSDSRPSTPSNPLQEFALSLGFNMFALLVQRITQLLETESSENSPADDPSVSALPPSSDKPASCPPSPDIIADASTDAEAPPSPFIESGSAGPSTSSKPTATREALSQLLPVVKVWCDWCACHVDLWNPPTALRRSVAESVEDEEEGSAPPFSTDVFGSLAAFFNALKRVDIDDVELSPHLEEGKSPVILDEDVSLAGFVPLLSKPHNYSYVDSSVEQNRAEECLRISQLRMFSDYLCGIDPPLLAYNLDSHTYESLVEPKYSCENLASEDLPKVQTAVDGGTSEPEVEEEKEERSTGERDDKEEDDHVKELREKREVLRQEIEERQRAKETARAVVDSHLQKRSTQLEIRPRYLLPDTNCYIDHLHAIQLIGCKNSQLSTTLVIPLIVLTELEGLAKGCRPDAYETHEQAQKVFEGAKMALSWVRDQFKYKSGIRAITSKGSILDTIAFRSEEVDTSQVGSRGNNDDLILNSCLHLTKDSPVDASATAKMPDDPGAPLRLLREAVLLTDDRNLRVKAIARNVPVKDVPDFVRWAKIG